MPMWFTWSLLSDILQRSYLFELGSLDRSPRSKHFSAMGLSHGEVIGHHLAVELPSREVVSE